jgi:type IV secretion system protein VirD4
MTGSLRIIYVAFCLSIALIVWLLAYGLGLQFLYQDGRIIHAMITTNPFAPLQQLVLYAQDPVLGRVGLGALVPAVFVASVIAHVGLRSHSNPLGDARFQTAASLRRGKWFRRKGHILGRFGRRLLRVSDERHHLVIGPTRSGKGACYVIPNALTHRGSMIVTDLKGEIFHRTAGYRKSKGNQVFLFAPGSDRTHRYNPLDFIRPDRGDRTTDIQNIASILVPENVESENAIWQATAQQVMAGTISYINESILYRGRRNLGEVSSFFNSGVNLQALMTFIKEQEPYLSRFTLESFNAYIALSERAAASALLDIQKALRPFRNERVVAATSVTDMDLRALKYRPMSIYIAPNITDITLLKPLLALFVQQTLDMLMLDHDPQSLPIYFLLDEFRQLKKMNEITSKLPYVAGYNIKMGFVIQDLKNLDEIYGETARHSLMGNCGYQLVLGANDQVTAETISKGLGKRTVRYKTESRTIELMGLHRRTKVEQLRERDLMMPQEVRQMSSDKMLVLVEGQSPILADKLRYFATTPLREMERFSRARLPDVPATEFLPPGPVPATTAGYLNVQEGQGTSHCSLTTGFSVSGHSSTFGETHFSAASASFARAEPKTNLNTSTCGRDRQEPTTSGKADRVKAAALSNTSPHHSIEARFAPAVRKLKTLIEEKARTAAFQGEGRDWSAIFDATVPDEEPIDVAGSSGA